MAHDDPTDASKPELAVRKSAARPAVVVFGLVVLAAGVFGLYGIARAPSKNVAAHTGTCARSLDLAQSVDPLTHGEMAALTVATQPNQLSAIAFDDKNGMKITIASFKGKTILLNLWATWCVPCRAEMPSLDKLQANAGSKDFAVIPVNIDTVRLDRPQAFLKEIAATTLPFYSDKTAEIVQSLKRTQKVVGLPTTILIGGDGCEIATMAGPAVWDSPDAKTLIDKVAKAGKVDKAGT